MGFWERVLEEIEKQNITRKELASNAKINESTIRNGITRNSIPQADIALRVAKLLNKPVEYLVNGVYPIKNETDSENLLKFTKYKETIDCLDSIPDLSRKTIENMIRDLSKSMEIERSIYEQQMKKNGKALNVAEK